MNRKGKPENLILPFILSLFLAMACASESDDPGQDSDTYREAVSNFYVSLAASQTDEARFAFNKMNEVAQAYPEEPAAWANLGVYAMRQGNFELSAERFETALELMPNQPDILFLAGMLESRRGDLDQSISYYRRGIEADPENLMIQYALVQELERQDDIAHADEILELLTQMHESAPDNQVVIFELVRVAAKEQMDELLFEFLESLNNFSDQWDEDVIEQFEIVKEAAANEAYSEVSIEISFLRNGIEPTPSFQEDLLQMQLAPSEVGFLITEFLWLPQPEFQAAEPDFELTFSNFEGGEFPFADYATFVTSVTLLEEMPPIAIYMEGSELHIDDEVTLAYPGNVDEGDILPKQILAEIDYNYNFLNDIALAGDQGFRLYRQNDDFTFSDVTSELNLPEELIGDSYTGVWSADLDQDGDLDLVLAREDREPVILRNNADGTFTRIDLFPGLENIVNFIWADLDGTGTGDALFLTAEGDLKLYRNLRHGVFTLTDRLPVDTDIAAIDVADLNADGQFDIVAVLINNEISLFSYERRSDSWIKENIVSHPYSNDQLIPGISSLFVPDLDNNGVLDILLSGMDSSTIWLGDSDLNYTNIDVELPGGIVSVFDIDGNERLDFLGIEQDGRTYRLMSSGSKEYGSRSIRARASGLEGDQRINSFGIGGEMEVRSGLLYQKQRIHSPIVHFGLGEYKEAEMLRIVWPNGSVQAEFAELGIGETIFNEQVLKGSCPWLFTHDGEEVQFITDALWRSPLGLRINAQETAGVVQTYDRVRIPGDKLADRNGIYDVRITAELWETHFFDYVDLIAVDHPEGTEVYVDERFVFPAPDLSTRIMKTPEPVKRVTDHTGNDVTEIVRRVDGNYLKAFEKTSVQGLVHDHYIEVEIGNDAPEDKPLYLLMSGWLRPTDSSINLALSQGSIEPPTGMMVEVADGDGGWELLHEDFGTPAGKTKTILMELNDVFPDTGDRRLRLHTTSEIYWDAIQWAEALPEDQFTETRLDPVKQELRFRGYSEWFRPDSISPKLPNYSEISGTAPRWRDLKGYHTRFGDVTELLSEIDDRYVIMNAGDELLLEYETIDSPDEGWTRTYIFVSDGWVKDGDYNTEASKTVHPLPYHGQSDYDYTAGGSLRDDPVFQRHRNDWKNYHTRYITPDPFRTALLFNRHINNR